MHLMVLRSSLDLELRPLLKALEKRLEPLEGLSRESKDGWQIYARDGVPFMHLEKRRDHMLLDLWLNEDQLEDARASGIARAHPFEENDAVRVRFERAADLTRVARWLEGAYRHARQRQRETDNRENGQSAAVSAAKPSPRPQTPARPEKAAKEELAGSP